MIGNMKTELEGRIRALCGALAADPTFETALIAGRVNQYYLTGTMQDGLFVLKKRRNRFSFREKKL